MSDQTKQSAVNLNTILLCVLLGVFGWQLHTTFTTSNSVIRLEMAVQNFPSRVEFETKITELNLNILNLRTKLTEIDSTLLTLRRQSGQGGGSPRTKAPNDPAGP